MKSADDDLEGIDVMSLRTWSTVTAAIESKASPMLTGSRKIVQFKAARVADIESLSEHILSMKKAENFLHNNNYYCFSSSVERSRIILNKWSRVFAICHRCSESVADDSWLYSTMSSTVFQQLFIARALSNNVTKHSHITAETLNRMSSHFPKYLTNLKR